jgi:hypothetical protein
MKFDRRQSRPDNDSLIDGYGCMYILPVVMVDNKLLYLTALLIPHWSCSGCGSEEVFERVQMYA